MALGIFRLPLNALPNQFPAEGVRSPTPAPITEHREFSPPKDEVEMQTIEVSARHVGTNPTDPAGLRRSQRKVLDEVQTPGVIVAFHAPTGAGKTHLLREINKRNMASKDPKRIVVAFPTLALVTQQAAELRASHMESWDATYERLVTRATEEPEGKAAQQLMAFERYFKVPADLRRSVTTLQMFEASREAPLAMTMDSLFYVTKGIVAAEAYTITKAVVRKILTSYVESTTKRRLEELVAETKAILSPGSGIGIQTAKRLRQRVSSWKIVPPVSEGSLVTDLMGAALPEDPTPGPKYHYTKRDVERLRSELHGSLVVFDEYHLMAQWASSRRYIERLRRLGARVLLMSGTPRPDFLSFWDTKVVDFDAEEAPERIEVGEPTVVFNHPLLITLDPVGFRLRGTDYNPNAAALRHVQRWDTTAPGPCALVFEALDRATSVAKTLMGTPSCRERVMLWTGPEKDPHLSEVLRGNALLAPDAIIVGTSALEVGIDLPFRNLYSEVLYHQSLMQRIGRVGRMGTLTPGEVHNVVLALNKSAIPNGMVPEGPIERCDLADVLLRIVGRSHAPDDEYEGLWLRGSRTAQFLAIVRTNGKWKALRGSSSLLKVYPPSGSQLREWFFLTAAQQSDLLRSHGVPGEVVARASWGELPGKSYAAYLSIDMQQIAGSLDFLDKPIDDSRVLRTWSIKSTSKLSQTVLLQALVPHSKRRHA